MSAVWISVIVVGLATMAIKAALVVTQALGGDNGGFTIDARLAGLAAGAAALLLRAPLLVVITAAAVTAALVRVVG